MEHIADETYNNGIIKVKAGDTIKISLPETPTAGYRWEEERAASAKNEKYACESDKYEPQEGNAVGGRQLRVFQYRISKSGEGKIRLVNKRSWSPAIDKAFELKVVAQ